MGAVRAQSSAQRRSESSKCDLTANRKSKCQYLRGTDRGYEKPQFLTINCLNDRGIMMRTKWSLAIHHEDRGEGSLISEDHFVHFADVHATMKRNKGKAFVVRIPKTAKPMEIQAFHNLKKLGYVIDAR